MAVSLPPGERITRLCVLGEVLRDWGLLSVAETGCVHSHASASHGEEQCEGTNVISLAYFHGDFEGLLFLHNSMLVPTSKLS